MLESILNTLRFLRNKREGVNSDVVSLKNYSLVEKPKSIKDWYTLIPAETQKNFELEMEEQGVDSQEVIAFISAHLEEARAFLSNLTDSATKAIRLTHFLELRMPPTWRRPEIIPLVALLLLAACERQPQPPLFSNGTEIATPKVEKETKGYSWEITADDLITETEGGKISTSVSKISTEVNGIKTDETYTLTFQESSDTDTIEADFPSITISFSLNGEPIGGVLIKLGDPPFICYVSTLENELSAKFEITYKEADTKALREQNSDDSTEQEAQQRKLDQVLKISF